VNCLLVKAATMMWSISTWGHSYFNKPDPAIFYLWTMAHWKTNVLAST